MLSNLTNLPEVVEPILTLALIGIAGGAGFLLGADTAEPPVVAGNLFEVHPEASAITAVCTVITTILAVVKFFKKRKNKK